MKRVHRLTSPRAIRLLSLVLCYSLIGTTVFLPLSPTVSSVGAQGSSRGSVSSSSRYVQPAGILGVSGRMLASLLTLFQGGGLPSVPGPNLPDLDIARGVQPTGPVAPSAIASTQACADCTPCPTCGPGSANHAPAAQAGGPYYGTVGTPLVVSGLGSFDVDPEDDISGYAWTFGDGTGVSTGATPAHTYATPGNYPISLTVTDSHNATAIDETTASITAAPPSVPPTGPTQGNAALFIAQTVPTTMTAGQSYPVSVTMRNTGTTTWSAAHLYRLGAENPLDNSLWGMSRVHLPNNVAPDADVTFNFTVIAPYSGAEEPPAAQFQWRMVQEFVGWFDTTPNQTVTIISNYQQPNPGVPEIGPFSSLFASRIAVEHRTGQPGEDLLSGNYKWGLGLVDLAGRAGLDLNLGLSYNSLAAWTKVVPAVPPSGKLQATSFTFDADRGFPSAGFRLGFPSIQGPFNNAQTGGSSYLALLPSGGRVELRRVGATNVYEAADSSYLQLVDGANGSLLLRTTDGTQLAYWSINSEYRCTEVKDRNGNFLTIMYESIHGVANLGRITSVIDTLQRTISFNYDTNFRLQSISQVRNGQTHLWATFGYTNKLIQTNFVNPSSGPAPVVLGLPSNHTVSVLSQVGLDDGSRYTFEYTSWGQVYGIRHLAADGHQLNYTSYNLPLNNSTPQTDCPRFTQRQDEAENWNSGNAVTTDFQIDPNGTSGEVTTAGGTPDQVTYKEFFTTDYSDWRRGLVTRTEIITPDSSTPKKTTITDWTQDATNVAYPLNPRPTAITISDAEGNRRRTKIEYGAFGLPSEVYEQEPEGTNGWQTLRRTHTDYNLSDAYVNRRIIGLVAGQYLFATDANGYSIQTLLSKTTMEYDAGGEFLQGQGSPEQYDPINYGTGLIVGRGNVTAVRRWDVNHETAINESTASSVGYNTTGSAVFTRDPVAGHQTTISYTDSFSTNGVDVTSLSFATLAYPTMVTVNDPTPMSSKVSHNYDLGVITRKEGPPPFGYQQGAIQTTEYDAAGRVKRLTNAVNSAYTRFVYPPSQTIVNKFTTIQEGQGEAYSATILDGAGRVRAVAGDFPDTAGNHYSGQFTLYDSHGRAVQSTNPTEMTNAWAATGADNAGWHSSSQTYDWKGRPLITTNQDGTTKLASYGGCGCAGGEVVTLTDEGMMDAGVLKRRQQKIYSDSLGRTTKTEVFNWQGGTVYSATVNTYNARDQVTLVRQYQGAEGSSVYQDTTMTFDGHGRLKTKHVPEQDANTATTYDYDDDDTVKKVTDARGASATFDYNGRHLVEDITYAVPSGSSITVPAAVSYGYDSAGNRTSMNDGSGSTTYEPNQLSQFASETRQFSGLTGSYAISYDYNLAGQLKKITEPVGSYVDYSYDSVGRMQGVSGAGLGTSQYASSMQYRAWGGLKSMAYGNTTSLSVSYNQRGQVTHYEVGGVKAPITSAPQPEGGDFQYYADGQVKFASDLRTDATASGLHDRAYSYDHAARLKEAYSGTEARDIINGTSSNVFDGAFRQTYEYDPFGNLTTRTGRFWSETDNASDSYNTQNRNPAWEYDADGRLLSRNEPSPNDLTYQPLRFSYDAAGRRTQSTQTTSRPSPNPNSTVIFTTATTRAETYDGAGVGVKSATTTQTNAGAATTKNTFCLRSTILGGRTISEYDSAGVRQNAYVFAGGELLAQQERMVDGTTHLLWEHHNPVTGDGLNTDTQGVALGRTTIDPMGVDFGDSDPFISEGGGESGGEGMSQASIDAKVAQLIPGFGGPHVKLDHFITSPHMVFSAASRGAVEQCPNNDCSLRSVTINVTYKDGTKKSIRGLVNPFLVPDGVNKTFTGLAARIGAAAFYGDSFEEAFKGSVYWIYLAMSSVSEAAYFAEPQDTRTDCQKFADKVEEIAKTSGRNVKVFMNKLATTFTEFPAATLAAVTGLSQIEGQSPNSNYLRFGSTGFASAYYEPPINGTPSNQVRHATGGLIAGYVGIPRHDPIAGQGMNDREDPNDPDHGVPDINLNNQTVLYGARIATHGNGPSLIGPRRIGGAQAVKALPDWIRNTLCAH